jgi:hypothetical protein
VAVYKVETRWRVCSKDSNVLGKSEVLSATVPRSTALATTSVAATRSDGSTISSSVPVSTSQKGILRSFGVLYSVVITAFTLAGSAYRVCERERKSARARASVSKRNISSRCVSWLADPRGMLSWATPGIGDCSAWRRAIGRAWRRRGCYGRPGPRTAAARQSRGDCATYAPAPRRRAPVNVNSRPRHTRAHEQRIRPRRRTCWSFWRRLRPLRPTAWRCRGAAEGARQTRQAYLGAAPALFFPSSKPPSSRHRGAR